MGWFWSVKGLQFKTFVSGFHIIIVWKVFKCFDKYPKYIRVHQNEMFRDFGNSRSCSEHRYAFYNFDHAVSEKIWVKHWSNWKSFRKAVQLVEENKRERTCYQTVTSERGLYFILLNSNFCPVGLKCIRFID